MKSKPIKIILYLLCALIQNALCANSILLVIDMQKGLLDTISSMHVQSNMINDLIWNVNENIKRAKEQGIRIVYIRNEWSNPILNYFTGNVCKKGTLATEIDKRICISDSLLFYKSQPSAFSNSMFSSYLLRNNIQTIYVEGIMAEGCINATGKAGIKKKLNVIMLEDAIGSTSAKTKSNIIRSFPKYAINLQTKL